MESPEQTSRFLQGARPLGPMPNELVHSFLAVPWQYDGKPFAYAPAGQEWSTHAFVTLHSMLIDFNAKGPLKLHGALNNAARLSNSSQDVSNVARRGGSPDDMRAVAWFARAQEAASMGALCWWLQRKGRAPVSLRERLLPMAEETWKLPATVLAGSLVGASAGISLDSMGGETPRVLWDARLNWRLPRAPLPRLPRAPLPRLRVDTASVGAPLRTKVEDHMFEGFGADSKPEPYAAEANGETPKRELSSWLPVPALPDVFTFGALPPLPRRGHSGDLFARIFDWRVLDNQSNAPRMLELICRDMRSLRAEVGVQGVRVPPQAGRRRFALALRSEAAIVPSSKPPAGATVGRRQCEGELNSEARLVVRQGVQGDWSGRLRPCAPTMSLPGPLGPAPPQV